MGRIRHKNKSLKWDREKTRRTGHRGGGVMRPTPRDSPQFVLISSFLSSFLFYGKFNGKFRRR